MIRVSNIKIAIEHMNDNSIQKKKIARALRTYETEILAFVIVKRSIDARDKNNIFYVFTFDVNTKNDKKYVEQNQAIWTVQSEYKIYNATLSNFEFPPVVVGSGPAGLFAALIMARAGLCPIILERGRDVDRRVIDVDKFMKNGILNTESNIQFGEGGAGTFSDGKLTTNIHDERIAFILKEFVRAGAPEDILYSAKPHVGTDYLVSIVKNIRKEIEQLGGVYCFNTMLCGIRNENGRIVSVMTQGTDGKQCEIKTNHVVLAIGHSARDTFSMLLDSGVMMRPKPFAVGVRIEHKQKWLNNAQYGKFSDKLPSADYKLATRTKDGRGVYTFCMCPGGTVVASSSETEMLCVNGMSNYKRSGENANSAILVSVTPNDFGHEPLDGVFFQRKLEKAAFIAGGRNYHAPVQLVGDFMKNIPSIQTGDVIPSYTPGYSLVNLRKCLDVFINDALVEAISAFSQKIKGFDDYSAVLTGTEARSSSPVTIVRSASLEAAGISGLYPCGEGAGYAGGIVSAAIDGIRIAEKICRN